MNIKKTINRLLGRAGEVRSATWDAAGAGNRLANWGPPSTDFASVITPEMLRRRARDAYRNNPWGRRAVEVVTTGAVGGGIKPQFRSKNPELKASVQREWLRWTDQADFAGQRDFYGFERDALRAAMVDGETIVRLLVEPGRVPLQLQLLSAEFLDNSRVDDRTLNGIEYDAAGRRVAYWLYSKHPASFPNMQSVRVPADQVIHLFAPIQPGMERGASWLAPALVALRELQEFIEASLVKQKIGALMTAFVTSPDGSSNPLGGTPTQPPTLEPGSAVLLQPGQDVTISEPPQAGDFEPFIRAQLRAIASALNVPYELLSGDVSQVTFASGRHSLLEFRRQLETIQHHLIVFQLCRPIWNAWTRLAAAAGVLPEGDYSTVRWIAPQIEMLDPAAETRNQVQRVRAGFISRSEVISRDGWDIEEIDAEIAADNARADKLGLTLDSDPRKTTAQGQEQAQAGLPQEVK